MICIVFFHLGVKLRCSKLLLITSYLLLPLIWRLHEFRWLHLVFTTSLVNLMQKLVRLYVCLLVDRRLHFVFHGECWVIRMRIATGLRFSHLLLFIDVYAWLLVVVLRCLLSFELSLVQVAEFEGWARNRSCLHAACRRLLLDDSHFRFLLLLLVHSGIVDVAVVCLSIAILFKVRFEVKFV